jgi:hypothetical protein
MVNTAFTFCQKDVGIMEYWNNGSLVPFKKPNIPAFHHSRFPRRLRSTNPLGMLIYIYKIVFGQE